MANNTALQPKSGTADARTFVVRVLRQDGPGQPSYWQSHSVQYEVDMNCISVLQKIAEQATTVDGRKVAPVVWE